MSIYSVYFSPTGGTEKVINIIMEKFSVDAQIDLSENGADFSKYQFNKEDVCFIAVPSFGGRVPALALDRLKQMRPNGALAVIIAIFGNRAYDDTLMELKTEAAVFGFKIGAAIAAVAEHSIIRQFGNGRPDADDISELRGYADTIKELVVNRKNAKDLPVPGNKPYKNYSGVPLKPKTDKSCTNCGICASKCPVGAIFAENPVSVDDKKCISCMRCIAICPAHAKKLNKMAVLLVSKAMKKTCSSRKKNELYL